MGNGIIIETDTVAYQLCLGQVQIEITARCNMNCRHCRNCFDRKSVLSLNQIDRILRFALNNASDNLELVISGGEPLIHPDLQSIFSLASNRGIKTLFITTNGSLLRNYHLPLFKIIKDTTVSVSLDDLDAKKHDAFRRYSGAFESAIKAVRLLIKGGVKTSIRVSLLPQKIGEIASFARFAYGLGVTRLAISSIFPVGRGGKDATQIMNRKQKQKFLQAIFKIRGMYLRKGMKITTNDPLQILCRTRNTCKKVPLALTNRVVRNGCGAAAAAFNVMANGDVTPCAMLNLPIFNMINLTVAEMEEQYAKSRVVQDLLDMNFKGKCGTCNLRFQCGGCRVRALARYNDFLAEDPDCWLPIK